MKRTLGKVINLNKCVSELSKKELYQEVLIPLWKNGCIVIKDQDLGPDQLVKVSKNIGHPVELPKAYSFDNLVYQHKSVVRVGNVNQDGSIRPNVTDGEYWHHHGDFWPRPKNCIISISHSIVVPKTGGNTGFIDMISPLHDSTLFNQQLIDKFRNSEVTVKPSEIPDFKKVDKSEQLEDTVHNVIDKHPITGEECLYLPSSGLGLYDVTSREYWANSEKYVAMIRQAGYFYEHKWEEGDTLIWDSIQVMHRSMGKYKDQPRLLLRSQSSYDESIKKLAE